VAAGCSAGAATGEADSDLQSRGPFNPGTYVAAPSPRLASDGMNSLRSKGELLVFVLKTDGTFYRAVSTKDDCTDHQCAADTLEGRYSFSSHGAGEFRLKDADGNVIEHWQLVDNNRDGFTLKNTSSGVASTMEASARLRWCKTRKDCALQDSTQSNPTGEGFECTGASKGIENGTCADLVHEP
jgi:hypothetical protein